MAATKVLGIVSQKGGVGKTTVSMLLADCLHHQGKNVVVVDTDPQKSAQKWESKALPDYAPFPVRVDAVSGLSEVEFAQWLERRATGVDYFIIDTPPNLQSRELRAALYIADRVILPFVPHATSIDALEEVLPLVQAVAQERGDDIAIRVLLNKVDWRRSSERAIVENAAKICPFPLMKARLKNLAAYADVANYRTSLYSLSVHREAREALEAVTKEACK